MKRIICATAVTLIAVASLPTATAQTLTVTVDCNRGQTIAHALKQGDSRKPLVVIVRGTCNEHVSISRDDVTLRGKPGTGATVSGPDPGVDTILILKDTVNIEDLTVTGGLNGIRLQGPSNAGVKNVLVRNTANNGIIVRAGDLAIENSTVEYAGGSGLVLGRAASARIFNNSHFRSSHFAGIYAQNNSTFTVNGGSVSDNEGHGINVDYGSDGTINNVEIFNNATGIMVSTSHASVGGGNFIHDNREHGVVAQAGAVLGVNGTNVKHNGQVGVLGYLGATVVMGGNEITENGESGVFCLNDCTLQISGDRITGNAHHGVGVQRRSTLIIMEPQTLGWVMTSKSRIVGAGSNVSFSRSETREKSMSYYLSRTVDAAFDEVVQRVTAALKEEGFGVLTDIDVQATLKAKLDANMPPYRILGACNPSFAHQALQIEDKLGVLLPCNVIVRDAGDNRTEVAAIDPVVSMDQTANPELASLAEQVRVRLRRAVERA